MSDFYTNVVELEVEENDPELDLDIDENDSELELEVEGTFSGGGTNDYEKLKNLPSINGEKLIGNKTSEGLHIVAVKTTEEWQQVTTIVSKTGEIYVYSDYMQDEDGNNIPGFKIGDGNAFIVDLPFATLPDLRISDEDIENWNNKVSVRIEGDRLIFY